MKLSFNPIKTPARIVAASTFAIAATILPLAHSTFAVSGTTSGSTQLTAAQQARLSDIKTKGDQEITRRLTSLNTLSAKITAATKLTASDKTTLTNEVSSTISGLTDLKTQLDNETTLSGAKTDAQAIYSQYRVYALVAPKIGLIKVADDQQVTETRLIALSQKLQARITADQQAQKDVTSLQNQLTDLNTKVAAAQAISTKVESSVIGLQPTDYNSDHAVLSGYNDQLKTARGDDQAAITDAKNIIAGLKALK